VSEPLQVMSCSPPGSQQVLFRVPAGEAPTYAVIDRSGVEHLHTAALGVALTAARRVLVEQGEVWIRASDDTCARIDPERVETDTTSCPWILTVAASLEAKHDPR
jgi:hypothetical protein